MAEDPYQEAVDRVNRMTDAEMAALMTEPTEPTERSGGVREALKAIAEGYPVTVRDDRYIVIENPRYQPDNGTDLMLVIDVEALSPPAAPAEGATTADLEPLRGYGYSMPSRPAPAPAVDSGAVGEPVAWRIKIGDSDLWGYAETENDADFLIKQSGRPAVKEPLYAHPPALSRDPGGL